MATCPGCAAADPSTDHLIKEYLDLAKHSFSRMFGHNARKAQDEVARELIARGVTSIPNMFGAIPVTVREGKG